MLKEILQTNKRKYIILIFVFIVLFLLSYIRYWCENDQTTVRVFCKSTENIGVILYTDNGAEDYPWGVGGGCYVQLLNKGEEIQVLEYVVEEGTENKLRLDFDAKISTDIKLEKIEIVSFGTKKVLDADAIEKNFGLWGIEWGKEDSILVISELEGIGCIQSDTLKMFPKKFRINYTYAGKSILISFLCCAILIIAMKYCLGIRKRECIVYRNIWTCFAYVSIIMSLVVIFQMLFEFGTLQYFVGIPRGTVIKVFWYNLVLCTVVALFVGVIFNVKIGVIFSSIISVMISLVNYYLMVLRGKNFLPWDMKQWKEAIQIISFNDLPWNDYCLCFVVVFVYLLVALIPLKIRYFNIHTFRKKVQIFAICVVVAIVCKYKLIDKNVFKAYQFAIPETYQKTGSLLAFLYFCSNAGVQKPDDYSEDEIMKIVSSIDETFEAESDVEPNIVMIMSEAFWNPEILNGVSYPDDFMHDYKAICEEGMYGEILSPHFGGGTCNVEFEALTGFSVEYIQNNLMPYQGIINNDFFSVARYLKEQGYTTTAIHPNTGTYYNREKVYGFLGFDRSVFATEIKNIAYRSWFIDDEEVVNTIVDVFEDESAPQFIFAVTIQNHQPYSVDCLTNKDAIAIGAETLEEDTKSELIDFSTGVNHSSEALGRLVEYLKKSEEPTIVIYWGDHMVPMGEKNYQMFRDMGYLGGEDNVDYMMYKTPILVWDNYAQLSGELKTRSTFQIMPTVFEQYNLEMPAYYRLLLSLQEETLGISHGKVYLDSEGDAWELDTELSENYKEMELLQYDYIYGKRYGEKVFH